MGHFDINLKQPTADEQTLFMMAMKLGYLHKKGQTEDHQLLDACEALKAVVRERHAATLFAAGYDKGQKLARMCRFEAPNYPFEAALTLHGQSDNKTPGRF